MPDGPNTSHSQHSQDTTGNHQTSGIFSAQANQPIHAADITFKLWITKHVAEGKNLNFHIRVNIDAPKATCTTSRWKSQRQGLPGIAEHATI